MRAYALVQIGDDEAIDVFVRVARWPTTRSGSRGGALLTAVERFSADPDDGPEMENAHTERPRAGWSYSGEAWTDARGQATILLPPFVRSHRAGFAYELTPIVPKGNGYRFR